MYRLIKRLSLPLALSILITSLPVQALTNSVHVQSRNPDNDIVIAPEKPEAKVISEDISKRDKFTKHYMKDDFTYDAVIYPVAAHYNDNGSWKDIDNSLVDSTDESNNPVLENKENDVKFKFSKKSGSNKLISIKKDQYKLSWNLIDAIKSEAVVDPINENALESIEKDNKFALKNLSSSLTYKDIQDGVDLQYVILPEEIKENIILSKIPANYSFKFELDAGKLDGKVNEDGSVSFTDPKTSEGIFLFNAPFMVDNSGAVSEEINVILQKTNNKYIMTITPDKAWLENPGRIYPVTIDPTVTTSSSPSAIFDTHVSSNFPTTVNNAAAKLVVGNNNVTGGSGVNRSYLQFVLPALTSADMVVDARLNLYSLSNSATQQEIDLYRVNAAWNRTTMNWNNKATFDDTVIHDLQLAKNIGWYTWNITTIAKGWYTSENNYGIMLKSKNENVFGYNEFYSGDIDSSLEVARPFLTISYVSSAGLEDYWTYHAYSAGRTGTAYVNDYNGNLVFIHDDISMNGYRLPISLSHVYNRYQVFESNGNTGYGKGWRLSLAQTIDKINIGGTNYYVYTDGDGTKHYFKSSAGIMHDESGLGLELTDSGTDRYYLKDKGYNEYIFSPKSNSSTYYLWSIKDQNGNEQLLYYNAASTRQIVQVKDGAGRSTYFTYNQTTGLLESIKDPAGRITRFGYNGTDLETITYPDGKVTKYEYTASGSMTAAINHDGFKTAIGYGTVRPYRVNGLKETHTDGTLGQETNITYGNHTSINTFTDASGAATTYFFDNFGRTTSVVIILVMCHPGYLATLLLTKISLLQQRKSSSQS